MEQHEISRAVRKHTGRNFWHMFQIERLQLIKQVLREQKSADVIGLSNYLKVSEVTVRRDLEKLEAEGFLKRTYGGAVLVETGPSEEKEHRMTEERFPVSEKNREFGELGAELVENHDVIFLDSSECSVGVAEYLRTKTGVVVFTNNLRVVQAMEQDQDNMVILIGGRVSHRKKTVISSSSNIPFPDIRVNKAFLSVQGVEMNYGLTVNDKEDAYIYQEIVKRARNKVIIMEGTVFDKIGLIKVDEITNIDYVITDSGILSQYKKVFYKNGVRIHQKFML